jgi:hypothetical protein
VLLLRPRRDSLVAAHMTVPMRIHSRLSWLFLCLCGLRHRSGEAWHLVGRGVRRRRISVCTRCGVRRKGMSL